MPTHDRLRTRRKTATRVSLRSIPGGASGSNTGATSVPQTMTTHQLRRSDSALIQGWHLIQRKHRFIEAVRLALRKQR